jgi:PAS domain S-box-containing protein
VLLEQARLLDLTHDTVFVRDMNDIITYWNSGAEELYGWKSEQAVGKVTHHLLQTSFPEPLEQIAEELLRARRWEGELVHTKRDGTQVIVASRWALQRDEQGNPIAVLEPNNDITDRTRAEEERERVLAREQAARAEAVAAQHRFRDLVNSIEGIVWEADAQTFQFLFVSQQAERILGHPVERWLSGPTFWKDHIHPDDREWAVNFCLAATAENRDHQFEYRMLAADGRTVWLRDLVTVVVEGDRTVRLRGVMVDISERVRASEALREAQTELAHVTRVTTLGAVTASFAHELNQPLAAIVNNANACLGLLASRRRDVDEVRDALADVVSDAERASAIIERVRGLATRSSPEKVPLRLRGVVEDVVALAATESVARRVAIRTDVAADLPVVLGDRVQLQQVLLNLVVNGMDAMSTVPERERLLEIRGLPHRDDGSPAARISVQDRGIGVGAAQTERLFEAFYTTKPHGMGMGLAISRSIITAHGGRLWVEPNPGPGATFSFSLPAAAASVVRAENGK